MPFEKGRQCCPCPEQDISFESKKNWFYPPTRNRNYLKMYLLLWQPRDNFFIYLPFDLSCSSSYCLPHFHTLKFSSLVQCPSDFPVPPLSFFISPVATSFPNSSHMFFRVHKNSTVLTPPCPPPCSFLTGIFCQLKNHQEVAMII